MNVGPIRSKLMFVIDIFRRLKLDVLVVPETHLTDTSTTRAELNAHGLHIKTLARPAPEMAYRSRVGGALAVIYRKNGQYDLSVLSHSTKGALSIMCRSRDGSRKCAIIACYVPPVSSPYSHWRAPLLAWVRDEYTRLSANFNDVIIAGDLNSRWGTMAPDGETRETADNRPPASDAAWRPFRSWCLGEGVRPTHGRPGTTAGYTTSGAPATKAGQKVNRAESDYILTGPDTVVEPLRPVAWESVAAQGAAVHRPVTCSIAIKPAASTGAVPPQQRGEAPVAPNPASARYHIPHYTSGTWKNVGTAICSALDTAEQITSNAASTFQEAVEALHGALRHGAELLQRPEVSIRSMTYRRFAGSSMPPQAARLLDIARSLRKEAHAKHAAAAHASRSGGDGGTGAVAAVAADDPAAAMLRKAARLQKRALKLARASVRARAIERDESLRNLRPRDAHGWFTTLRSAVAGDNPMLQESASRIPDSDGEPATTVFARFFGGLFSAKPAPGATVPGATSPDGTPWTDFIPTADKPDDGATPLDAPFDWTWVYLTLFPPPSTARSETFPFVKCRPGCKRCNEFVDSRADDAPAGSNPLDWRPRINTSTAPGVDGLRAELIRWTQREDNDETWMYRCRMAVAVTDTINKALRDGMYPDLAKAMLVALYKGKGDRSDPSLYRGIAMQNLVPKILSTLLSARLSHWAQWHGLISGEQIGFKHRCGSEYHVMALLETLKARSHDGYMTSVLFVDFQKAYDCVHHEAVWLTLTKMGVPPALVNFLRAWAQMRKVAVRVNGTATEPFSVETGVAQGDPLSPLLFNLFMQSLSGWLASRPDLHGARVNPKAPAGSAAAATVLCRLFYADDLAIIDTTPAGLQRALDHIKAWADAWGMRINCSAGKTEAIQFSPHGVPKPAPLTCGDQTVSFADSYVYLGRTLWHDMRGDTTDHIGPVVSNFSMRFEYNTGMRRAAASSQLQMLKSCVLGAANYLRGIELLPESAADKIDVYTKCAGRLILGLPSRCSSTLTWALSGLLTARGTNAREMHRIDLQLRNTPHDDLDVVRVVAATALRAPPPAAPPGAAFNPGRLTSWKHAHAAMLAGETARGAVVVPPADYSDISRSAFVLGRSIAYNELRRDVRRMMPQDGDTASLPPRTNGSEKSAIWLLCGMRATAQDLGDSRLTALSKSGPGCNSLHTLADHSIARATASAALGNEALARFPFSEEQWQRKAKRKPKIKPIVKLKGMLKGKTDGKADGKTNGKANGKRSKGDEHVTAAKAPPPPQLASALGEAAAHDDDSDPEGDVPQEPASAAPLAGAAPPASAPYKERFEQAPCRLCAAPDSSSIYHLITDCPHPRMHDARTRLRRSLPAKIRGIVRGCFDATHGAASISRTEATPEEAAALALITAPDGELPDNDDGRMLMYRILVGVTWPRDPMARAGGTFPASAALGAIFDATTAEPSRLRRMAAGWLAWSEEQLCRNLALEWRQAQGLKPMKPRKWSR